MRFLRETSQSRTVQQNKKTANNDNDDAEERTDRLTLDFRINGSLPVDKRRVAFLAKVPQKMILHTETRSPCYLTYAVNRVQYDPF